MFDRNRLAFVQRTSIRIFRITTTDPGRDLTEALIAVWEDYRMDRVYPRYVKVYYDGGPDNCTALLLDEFQDPPRITGSWAPRCEGWPSLRQRSGVGVEVEEFW